MLELSLPEIAESLPDDDTFPRWYVVPPEEIGREGGPWASAMAELLAAVYFEADPVTGYRELLERFGRAVAKESVQPFDQRLFYLPFGAVSGLIVDVVTVEAPPSTPRELVQRNLLGLNRDHAVEEIDDGKDNIGFCYFHVGSGESHRLEGHRGEVIPKSASFWCVHRRLIEGSLVDIVATASSVDLELAALGYHTYRELILDPDLYR